MEGVIEEYHKIQTVFKRDPETKFKTLLEGKYATPEFDYLKDNQWIFTEKVDGTNIRVIWDENDIFFKGKTNKAQIPPFLASKLEYIFIDKPFENIFDGPTCLYGEGYGAKIQKGGKYIPDGVSFVLFDVKISDWWLKRGDVEDIAQKLGIDVVPIIGVGTLEDMVELAELGFGSQWGNFQAEGIVAHPDVELKTRSGHRIITKIKYKDFPR